MRDRTYWRPERNHACADGKARTVYVRGVVAPFVGWMATPDNYFACPAYVRHKGRRVLGFVTSTDDGQVWHPLDAQASRLEA